MNQHQVARAIDARLPVAASTTGQRDLGVMSVLHNPMDLTVRLMATARRYPTAIFFGRLDDP
ncbi:hypothetical protein ASD02_25175 [Ensifer sp. Root1252]|nr:hypothetical protein ASD02_25175 [Ensifer sp. Root1252]KRC79324.1 hypothetical protein ASE32_25715 [Ensifer sp. Root231]KRC99716.1 hypothetical protein ASE47_26075 [Ensifer sp. Root258]